MTEEDLAVTLPGEIRAHGNGEKMKILQNPEMAELLKTLVKAMDKYNDWTTVIWQSGGCCYSSLSPVRGTIWA